MKIYCFLLNIIIIITSLNCNKTHDLISKMKKVISSNKEDNEIDNRKKIISKFVTEESKIINKNKIEILINGYTKKNKNQVPEEIIYIINKFYDDNIYINFISNKDFKIKREFHNISNNLSKQIGQDYEIEKYNNKYIIFKTNSNQILTKSQCFLYLNTYKTSVNSKIFESVNISKDFPLENKCGKYSTNYLIFDQQNKNIICNILFDDFEEMKFDLNENLFLIKTIKSLKLFTLKPKFKLLKEINKEYIYNFCIFSEDKIIYTKSECTNIYDINTSSDKFIYGDTFSSILKLDDYKFLLYTDDNDLILFDYKEGEYFLKQTLNEVKDYIYDKENKFIFILSEYDSLKLYNTDFKFLDVEKFFFPKNSIVSNLEYDKNEINLYLSTNTL